MFVENFVADFYNVISKNKVLIFVNYDIDAICAAKILQSIFRHDSIAYILIPVSTIADLKDAFKEHIQDIKYVILINCGGTIDIVEELEPEENVTFFVVDSHRPTDLYNIYVSHQQVHLLCKRDKEESIPVYEDIFRESDDEVDEADEADEDHSGTEDPEADDNRASKRLRLDERMLERRRNRRTWEENRQRLLFDYVQFSYYGRSSAITMFELSLDLKRDNVDLLWWGIVGVVEQFILNKVEIMHYLNEVEILSAYIGRVCPKAVSDSPSQNTSLNSTQSSSTTSLRINCEKDLQLALYRHWTVESSVKYTMFTAVALQLWAIKGEKRLQRLLAEMGLPLAASRQQYTSMDLTLRKEFHSMMEKMSDARNLAHITYPSFTLIHGFRTKYQAADYVYSLSALLSNTTRNRSLRDCFFDALDALSRTKKDLIDDGIEKSKKFLVGMFKQVQNALDMKQVISAGPFFYIVIQEDTVNAKYFSKPDCLWLLATFTLRAYVAASRSNRAARLPLLASTPLDDGYCLIVGVPPVAETAPRSFFGQAFAQVAEKTGCNIFNDYFDSTVVRVAVADRPKIFDTLAVLLS